MAKPPPGASDDQLLNANAFRTDDAIPPPRVQRTPTRKERVVMPGSPRKRTPTMVETPPILKETEEIVPSFRPRQRPSMALLTIYDDGRDDGEEIRVRRESTVIGRGQGDVVIPHDDRMSGKHAEIRRVHEDGSLEVDARRSRQHERHIRPRAQVFDQARTRTDGRSSAISIRRRRAAARGTERRQEDPVVRHPQTRCGSDG